MMKKISDGVALVIVEAPGKVELLKAKLKSMGLVAEVMATAGHIAANPQSLNAICLDQRLKETSYRVRPDRVNLVEKMLRLAKGADKIFIATDDDHEGDVIAYDITWVLGNHSSKLLRCRMRSLSDDELNMAFESARSEDFAAKANIGVCRRIIDRAIGATYSVGGDDPIAAGRVQCSMLLKIAAQPIQLGVFKIELPTKTGIAKATIPIYSEAEVDACLVTSEELRQGNGRVLNSRTLECVVEPFGYYDILDMACERLGVDVKDASDLLQSAYEKGKVSYPRAGRVGYSSDAIKLASDIAKNNRVAFNPDAVKRKKNTGDPHESPRCLDENILLGRALSLLHPCDALSVLITRHMMACGQPTTKHVLSVEINKKQVKLEIAVTGQQNNWTEKESLGFIRYSKDRALLNYMSQYDLGRPSTIVAHIKKFIDRDLIDADLQLTDKGIRWQSHAEKCGFNKDLSADIEQSLQEPFTNPSEHALSILARYNMISDVRKKIEHDEKAMRLQGARLNVA